MLASQRSPPTARSGSTPACTGPTASPAPRRATATATPSPASSTSATTPTSARSRTPASSSRSATTSSARAASWICGSARLASSSTARAPAPTSRLRGEGEPLSGGGRSSGLMSFLRIGDRAAGAIKSGGTTRRAAKMVVLDVDHPDIEAFVDWKVVEEQKVAAWSPARKPLQPPPQPGLTRLRGRRPQRRRALRSGAQPRAPPRDQGGAPRRDP
jgi:hypothetical protein